MSQPIFTKEESFSARPRVISHLLDGCSPILIYCERPDNPGAISRLRWKMQEIDPEIRIEEPVAANGEKSVDVCLLFRHQGPEIHSNRMRLQELTPRLEELTSRLFHCQGL